MNLFNFHNFFGSNDHKKFSKKAQQRRRGRTCRIEALEEREMLDAGLMSALNDAFNVSSLPAENDTVIMETQPDENMTGNTAFGSPAQAPATAPAGYYENDWVKVEAAKVNNGLTDSHITWTETNGVYRLTSISANNAGLTGSLNLSGCTALTFLACNNNQLTALNVSNNTALTSLNCNSNQLTALDVSNNTALIGLSCHSNRLTALDVSGCTALQMLFCYSNQLKFSTLRLPSHPLFNSLDPQYVPIPSSLHLGEALDDLASEYLGGTTSYVWIRGNDGRILTPGTHYTVANGVFTFTGLQNGDVIWCTMTNPSFPGMTLETTGVTIAPAGYNAHDWVKVEAAKVINGLTDSHVTWTEINGVYRLTAISANSAGLTGNLNLSGCTALQTLSCYSNQLKGLDVSGCMVLQTLFCYGNQLKFSTLHLPSHSLSTCVSNGQTVLLSSSLNFDEALSDLVSEYLGGTTTYTWYRSNRQSLTSGTHYTAENGIFTFTGLQNGDVIFCEMTNPGYPSMTLSTTEVTITTTGYNENDWHKVEAAKAINGLTDSHVTWTEINGVYRLTRINAYYSGLTGSLDLSGCTALQYRAPL